MWRMWLTLAVLASIGCGQATTTAPPPLPAVAQNGPRPVRRVAGRRDEDAPCRRSGRQEARQARRRLADLPGTDRRQQIARERHPHQWPEEGPRIVWQRKLGEGYGIGSIAEAALSVRSRRRQGTARLPECRDRRRNLEERVRHRLRRSLRLRRRPALLADGRWRPRLYLRRGRDAALPRRGHRRREWKVIRSSLFGVVQNFFGVGSTPVIEGDLLIVMVGGSPPTARPTLCSDARSPTAPASSPSISSPAKSLQTRRRTRQLCQSRRSPRSTAAAGASPSPAADCWPSSPTGKVDFHYPWRAKILESVNASMPVVVGNQVFISETYGPGSSLLEVKPGDYDVVWTDDAADRDKSLQTHWNTPIEHRRLPLRIERPPHGERRAALHRAEDRQSDVERARPHAARRSSTSTATSSAWASTAQLQLLKVNPKKYDLVAEVLLRDQSLPALPGNRPRRCSSIPPGPRRFSRTDCSTCGERIGWCAWS